MSGSSSSSRRPGNVGRTAQTTFTDGNRLQFNTAPFSVAFNVCSPRSPCRCFRETTLRTARPTPVTLTSSSAGGKFYSNSACTTQITSVTIPTSASTASFFYKDANTGSPVVTAAAGTGCNGNNCTVTQTETITGPDLTITKSHVGELRGWSAFELHDHGDQLRHGANIGAATVTDVQLPGLTFSAGPVSGWTCSGTTTVSCTRSNSLTAGSSYPAITLNATAASPGSVTNVVTVAGGGEANTGNNSAVIRLRW